MTKVYISGPMSGYDDLNFPAFYEAEERLKAMGYEVVNPATLNAAGSSWEACMRKDVRELMNCDTVVTLPGWEKSRGAKIEVNLATVFGMEVIAYELITAKEEAV